MTLAKSSLGELFSRSLRPADFPDDEGYEINDEEYFGPSDSSVGSVDVVNAVSSVDTVRSIGEVDLDTCVRKVKPKELSWQEVKDSNVDPGFKNAIRKELSSFIDHDVFEVVKRPKGRINIVPFRIICNYKYEDPADPDRITRSKWRLVYKGFKDGRLDTGLETSWPTISQVAIRTVLQM